MRKDEVSESVNVDSKAIVESEASDSQAANTTTSKVVKNKSTAKGEKFSYNYSNLADIAEAGVEIPEMRVKPTDYGEYIEYKDDNNEWQLGAKIIELPASRMNPAQAYGSALTYARRYTTMLAKRVACNDDDQVEDPKNFSQKTAKNPNQKNDNRIDFKEVFTHIRQLNTEEDLVKYWSSLKLTARQKQTLQPAFAKRKAQINAKTSN